MKNILQNILVGLLCLIMTPVFMVDGVVRQWRTVFGDPRGEDTVNNLLLYGRRNLGLYKCGMVVCKSLGDNIWSKDDVWVMKIPDAILQMKVSTWDIMDGKLWIKVVVDDQLLDKLERELTKGAQNEAKEDH